MTGRVRRSPAEQRDERRPAIVDAARRVLARGGFERATIAAIAREAGISAGTVYLYFTNREDLLAEVYRYASSHEVAAMTSAALGDTPVHQFHAAAATFVERAFLGRRLAYALIAEPADRVVTRERNRARREFGAVFTEIIAAGVADGSFPPQNAHIRGAAVIGAINEAAVEALDPATDVEPSDELVADIVAAACATVGIPAPTRSATCRRPRHPSPPERAAPRS
ncbi:TetR/AcrR family transcriptional regulator [Pseudonocardia acaciae]|uniref:TetR/AcrR family transcriptional regulator n=1 Tax=Pseudonocardia acaciae TaxID=551276 RepID=UPI0006888691|nr:TetR/AcrR family transcriptional regulator [Pseudonocardia acaciae]